MKVLKALLLTLIAAMFISCDNITEEIYLKEDGSGEYNAYYDMVPAVVSLSVKMEAMFGKLDTTDSAIMDSLRNKAIEKVWEDFPDEIDSIVDYSQTIPDSLLNYGNNRHYIEKTRGYFKGSKSEGSIITGVAYTFEGAKDLNNFLNLSNEIQGQSRGIRKTSSLTKTRTEAKYSYSKNEFSRKVKIKNPQSTKDKSFKLMKEMMGSATYLTIIHTPKNVTKVVSKVPYTVEGKTVSFSYSLIDVLTGNTNLNFKIKMEE